MNALLQKDGFNVFADILCGEPVKLDGLYVTYSNKPVNSVETVDFGSFEALAKTPGCGYARVPIRSRKNLGDGRMLFTALLSASDFIGAAPTKRTKLTTATLVSFGADPSKDRFVYSSVLKTQIAVVEGSHMVIDLTMSIGGKDVNS